MGIQVDRDDPRNHHPYYEPPSSSYLTTVAVLLDHLCKENKDIVIPHAVVIASGGFATPWAYEWATIIDYMDRLREWIVCGPESFIGAFCLLKRLENIGAIPPITQRTVHRLFLTCLVLAVKFLEDETLSNKDFAKVGCVTVTELNRMECDALNCLGFDASILPGEYLAGQLTLKRIDAQIAKKKPLIVRNSASPLTLGAVIEVPERNSLSKKLSKKFFRKSLRSRSSFADNDMNIDAISGPVHADLEERRVKSMMLEDQSNNAPHKPEGSAATSKLERLKSILIRDYKSKTALYASITSTNRNSRGNNPVFLVRQDSLSH